MPTDYKLVDQALASLAKSVDVTVRKQSDSLFRKWILLLKAYVTGNLYKSVKTRTDASKLTVDASVDVADYGILVNAGDRSRAPKPFAYAAVRELTKTLIKKVKEEYGGNTAEPD